MKKLLKTLGIQLSMFIILLSSLGIIYAAWNDTVSSGDPLTAESWNEAIQKLSGLDSNISINGTYVGIGVSSPTKTLDVDGSIGVSANGNAPILSLTGDNTSSWGGNIAISAYNEVNEKMVFSHIISDIQSRTNGVESSKLILRNRQSSNGNFPSNAIVIDGSNGNNVGIGTSTPGSKLSVIGLPSGTTGANAGLDGSSVGAVCIMSDGDMYIDTDGVCN